MMSEVHKGKTSIKTKQEMFDVAFKEIFLPYVLRELSGMRRCFHCFIQIGLNKVLDSCHTFTFSNVY
jgi:hypothetical protein